MIGDIVYPSDIAMRPEPPRPNCQPSGWNDSVQWTDCPPTPPPYPYPYYPPCPPAPEMPDVEIKQSSVEAQICKLSKKSSIIKKMIENFENKNKDAIIKIGEVSYNFGSYKIISTDSSGEKTEEDSVYGETILEILTDELAAIKTKMVELTAELDAEDETTTTTSSTEKTVTQS